MEKQTSCPQQMEFMDVLFKKESTPSSQDNTPKVSERRALPRNQQVGFRHEYDQAMITLYVFGCLFRDEMEKQNAPEIIKHAVEKAKKTQVGYERYKPNASQKIIHYGRDVVDASIYMKDELPELRAQAENSKYPDKWRMFCLARKTLENMVRITKEHNKD